jgi:hypothetical protein
MAAPQPAHWVLRWLYLPLSRRRAAVASMPVNRLPPPSLAADAPPADEGGFCFFFFFCSFLHARLCPVFQSAIWHSFEQYTVCPHPPHRLTFTSSRKQWEQLVEAIFVFFIVLLVTAEGNFVSSHSEYMSSAL